MCSITIEDVKPIINILSALLTPTIAIFSTIFICQQKIYNENNISLKFLN